jgi:hypothetical protein
MANGHGGDRVPANPAPVSGPGAMSRRTDGQGARYMSGGQYGEGQELMDLQTSAPMSKAPAQPRMRQGRPAGQIVDEGARPTPLFAPTERPDEPITAGAPFGPGPGPAPEPVPGPGVAPKHLEVMARYLPAMREVAAGPEAPTRFRALVRYLEGNL